MTTPELTRDDIRGLNAAWAVANIPGTALTLVGSKIVAFARDTGHTQMPAPQLSKFRSARRAPAQAFAAGAVA